MQSYKSRERLQQKQQVTLKSINRPNTSLARHFFCLLFLSTCLATIQWILHVSAGYFTPAKWFTPPLYPGSPPTCKQALRRYTERNTWRPLRRCHYADFPPPHISMPLAISEGWFCISLFILLHEKFLQFDWLRAVVFQLNLKYLHVKITKLLPVVV